jgi:hypothetical protein
MRTARNLLFLRNLTLRVKVTVVSLDLIEQREDGIVAEIVIVKSDNMSQNQKRHLLQPCGAQLVDQGSISQARYCALWGLYKTRCSHGDHNR